MYFSAKWSRSTYKINQSNLGDYKCQLLFIQLSIPVTVLLVPWAKLYCHKNDVSGATGENPKQLHPRSIGHSKCCAAWNANSEKSDQQVWLPSAHCHNILFLVQKSCDCETVVQVTEKLILRDTVTPRLFYIWQWNSVFQDFEVLRLWSLSHRITLRHWISDTLRLWGPDT